MKVHRRGKGAVGLSQNDFVSSGGEGKIFRKNNLAYKIYYKPKNVPAEAHIDELSALKRSNIIVPIDILLDSRNKKIGYTTEWVDGIPMCKFFVGGFRQREGITDRHIIKLVENIKDTISYIHSHDIVMVDGNELNYIIGKDLVTPYFIDTTCWQTRSYPATVIMPSIRDYTSKTFNKMTDWFSFAVIACWLFTGVHPFRGKHDVYDKKFKDAVEKARQRVIDGVSIFNKNTRVARNARMNSIPKQYKAWFVRMFEKCERALPPAVAGAVSAGPVVVKTITGTNNFDIRVWKHFVDDVIWFTKLNGIYVTKTAKHMFIGKHKVDADRTTCVVFSPKYQIPVVARIVAGVVEFTSPEKGSIADTVLVGPRASELMIVENHLYYRLRDMLVEMRMVEMGDRRVIPATKEVWNIMPNSSKLFAGVVVQNMLGKMHVTIPLPREDGRSECVTISLPELDGYRIYDAKYLNHVLVVHGRKKNDYHTMVFRFDKDHLKYDIRVAECDDIGDVNMTVLDNGIAVMILKEGALEAFGNRPFVGDIKSIRDPVITPDMRLCKDGTRAMFIRGNEIYTIKMT